MHPETLRNWVRHAEIDGGVRPGTTTSDAERLTQLERENRELRRAKEMADYMTPLEAYAQVVAATG